MENDQQGSSSIREWSDIRQQITNMACDLVDPAIGKLLEICCLNIFVGLPRIQVLFGLLCGVGKTKNILGGVKFSAHCCVLDIRWCRNRLFLGTIDWTL